MSNRSGNVLSMDCGDRELVQRMLAGEEDAFDRFFDDHFPGLFRFALARVEHDTDLADEVVQATLCKAIDRLETYRGEAALFTWLCTICRRQIIDHFRRVKRSAPIVELVEEAPEIQVALEVLSRTDGMGPEAALRRKEVAHWVRVTLDNLPPKYRKTLQWKYMHGLSVNEIATRLDLRPKAAESVLTRSRKAFREGFRAISSNQQSWTFGPSTS